MRHARNGLNDFTDILEAMKVCRDAMTKIHTAYNSRHPIYREAIWLMTDIDTLAGILTGHRDLFHEQGSTTDPRWQQWRKNNA
jgi:hypothetical protein